MASRSPSEANSSNHHRNDSFASYLALVRQSFTNELANSRRSSFQAIAPPRRTSRDHNGELDVFTAEKYFNGSPYVQDYYPIDFASNDREKKSKNTKSFSKSRSSTCSGTSANNRSFMPGHRQNSFTDTARRRRSFFDIFWCYCLKKNTIVIEEDVVADIYSDKSSTTMTTKLPSTFRKGLTILNGDSSSESFKIDTSVSMNSQALCEPMVASIDWSITTAKVEDLSEKRRRPSGLLAFSCVSEKAVSVSEDQKVSANSLERYHVMMALESENVARSRRASEV